MHTAYLDHRAQLSPGWRLTLLFRCIYEYDEEHTIGGKSFKEGDPPNFTGSFYSDTKGMVEKVCVVERNTKTKVELIHWTCVVLCCAFVCVLDTHATVRGAL